MKKCVLLLTLFSAALFSCRKTNSNQPDFFIVSQEIGYGYFPNVYAPIYSINDSSLLCDTLHPEVYQVAALYDLHLNYRLPDSVFAHVKDIPHSIPIELLAGGGTYGSSGIDGSVTYIFASVNGRQYRWQFYDDLSGCSPAVQHFAARLWHIY